MFERRVYPRGETQTPAKFRRACRLVAAALHPEHLETAHEQAKKQTDVTKWVEDAGMASLRLHGPAPVITEIWDVGEHRSPRASPRREESRRGMGADRGTPRSRCSPGGPGPATRHLRGLGITSDGADAFDPTQRRPR